jgi:nicotinamidase-related amidase
MADWKMEAKTALIVLHVQNSFMSGGPESPITKAIRGSGMVEHVQALLAAFRDKKYPVFFAGVIGNPLGVPLTYGMMFKNAVEPGKSAGVWDAINSESQRKGLEPIAELGRRPDEPLVINWRLSAFNMSGLDLLLKTQGIKNVVLTGFAGNVVVYNTAVSAVDLGYSVIIARDATAPIPGQQKAYESVMDIMAPMISLVSTSDDIIAHL